MWKFGIEIDNMETGTSIYQLFEIDDHNELSTEACWNLAIRNGINKVKEMNAGLSVNKYFMGLVELIAN